MDLVSQMLEQIDARIAELEPLLTEYRELERVRAEMVGSRASSGVPTGPGQVAAAAGRDDEVQGIVARQPGITAVGVGDVLGSTGDAYRSLAALLRAGRVSRRGNGYYPV